MADVAFNISKGKTVYYCELPAAADALIAIPIEAAGVEADATIVDHDNLSLLLAGTSNEQATMGRKTISASVTITVDDANNRVDVDIPDQVWVGAAGNAISDIIFAYDGDTGAGTDANIIPLTMHDFPITPDGSDVTATIAAAGFFRAA